MEGADNEPLVARAHEEPARKTQYDADLEKIEKVKPWVPDTPQPGSEDVEPDYGDLHVLEELNVREGLRDDPEPLSGEPVAPKVLPFLLIALGLLIAYAAISLTF